MTTAWFESWFDTPWYHLLYRHRDESEAFAFIDRLVAWLQPAPGARVLDLACGKGRHARRLAEHDLDVTGIDLSHSNITAARNHEKPGLAFYEHDMRKPFRSNYFDVTVNLFTSFGYFEHTEDNLRSLDAIRRGLRPGGRLVLDFFNVPYVLDHLVPEEDKLIEGIHFHIRREFTGTHIVKTIVFESAGTRHQFEERVQTITQPQFADCFQQLGMELTHQFGDYGLGKYEATESPRLIMVAQKAGK